MHLSMRKLLRAVVVLNSYAMAADATSRHSGLLQGVESSLLAHGFGLGRDGKGGKSGALLYEYGVRLKASKRILKPQRGSRRSFGGLDNIFMNERT